MQCELMRVHKPHGCTGQKFSLREKYVVRRLKQFQDPNYQYEQHEASEPTTEIVTGWLHNIANLNVIFEKSRDMCVAQQR
jgi:hypothetical protein